VPQTSVLSSTTAASPHAPPPFASTCKKGGSGASWVTVVGELDILTSPQLSQTLREAQLDARLVVLDLRGLTFIDAAGVHVILDAAARAREDGHRLLVIRSSPQVQRVFTLTGACSQVLMFDLAPGEPDPLLFDAQRSTA
jgi:anti-sigma B factor antagonist